jgi:tetrapyrrole methylase family protein/MazG family protein
LRGPDGCPWDRKQTLRDIGRFILEEACEVSDAIAAADGEPDGNVCEELGDLLMTSLLAAQIAEEKGAFSIDDVSREICEKLVRRHPHVFGSKKVSKSEEVLDLWEKIKSEEKGGSEKSAPESRLANIPRSLPPLARAFKISSRAARAGFEWPDATGVLEKLEEEIGEVRSLLNERGQLADPAKTSHLREELGDILFTAVNLCRQLGFHPDEALRSSMKKFMERFRYMESRLSNLEEATLEEMDRAWDEKRTGKTAT